MSFRVVGVFRALNQESAGFAGDKIRVQQKETPQCDVSTFDCTAQHTVFFIFTLLSLLLKSHLLPIKDINTACGLCHLSALEVVVSV